MPLFPAYASSDTLDIESEGETGVGSSASAAAASPALEARLLASDDDGDADSAAAPPSAKRHSPADDTDFYLDTTFDGANLPVTTLYYPGRPQYDLTRSWKALGWREGDARRPPRGKRARRRYYSGAVPSDAAAVASEVAARAQALRRALADAPADLALWHRYVAFQERWAGPEAALRAAAEAEEAGVPLRDVLLRVRARHSPRVDYCSVLQRHIAQEKEPAAALHLWVRLVRAAGGEGAGAATLTARALHRLRHSPLAYPHLLYAYGCWVRDAGLWELLTLLVELVVGVCFGGDTHLPPPPQERLDARLQAVEDKIIGSGLPMHTVWARVERARADAHWHRAGGAAELDPQRAPHPADVADLLLPVADPDAALLLTAQLLRLAKVPLLPACGATAHASSPSDDEPAGGEAMLPLVAAARRLPAAHPARCGGAALAARIVARFLDPPHYFSGENGYLRWVDALWDACCERTCGERRTALLCWRMRWWHALLLLVEPQVAEGADEARRILTDARAALKRFEDASPLPFVLFARVQRAAGGGAEKARGVAARALRSALADGQCPPHHRLYAARIVEELDRTATAWGAWATACAALGRPLPPDAALEAPPPEELTLAALDECRRRCAQLERRFEAEAVEGEGEDVVAPLHAALLPGAGEWASALVRLAAAAAPSPLPPPARLASLVARAPAEAARYWEQMACAWTVRAARTQRQARDAHALAPIFPRNAFLALAAGGAPLWAWQRVPEGANAEQAHDSPEATLAPLLPRLLRAERAQWPPEEADRVAAACVAAAYAGGGGALAWCVRIEAEARSRRGRTRAALLGVAEAHPHHKWALARGAALCPAEAAAVPDLLLERHLRVHALPDELRVATVPIQQ